MNHRCVWFIKSEHFITVCKKTAPYLYDGYSLCDEHITRAIELRAIGETQ